MKKIILKIIALVSIAFAGSVLAMGSAFAASTKSDVPVEFHALESDTGETSVTPEDDVLDSVDYWYKSNGRFRNQNANRYTAQYRYSWHGSNWGIGSSAHHLYYWGLEWE